MSPAKLIEAACVFFAINTLGVALTITLGYAMDPTAWANGEVPLMAAVVGGMVGVLGGYAAVKVLLS